MFLTGPNTIESSPKLLKQSPVKNLLQACSFIIKRLRRSCFSVIFGKYFGTLVAPKNFFTVAFFF